MVKSPVEGSTAALIRLETPVVFSDYIRPICLPDILRSQVAAQTSINSLDTDANTLSRSKKEEKFDMPLPENREYFFGPDDINVTDAEDDEDDDQDELVRQVRAIPIDYSTTSTDFPKMAVSSAHPEGRSLNTLEVESTSEWAMCNTLGWARQRDHLQRVQLKFSSMATCENISIATVNSMCTEAAFQKQDCSEEEYSGSPVMCILPNSNRWALVGIASWRIACQPNGIERPRMYDKIAPNSAWIRHTINAT